MLGQSWTLHRTGSVLETDYLAVVDLEAVVQLNGFVRGFLAGPDHASERSAHARVAVVFRQLHTGYDQAWEHFSRVVDDQA